MGWRGRDAYRATTSTWNNASSDKADRSLLWRRLSVPEGLAKHWVFAAHRSR